MHPPGPVLGAGIDNAAPAPLDVVGILDGRSLGDNSPGPDSSRRWLCPAPRANLLPVPSQLAPKLRAPLSAVASPLGPFAPDPAVPSSFLAANPALQPPQPPLPADAKHRTMTPVATR